MSGYKFSHIPGEHRLLRLGPNPEKLPDANPNAGKDLLGEFGKRAGGAQELAKQYNQSVQLEMQQFLQNYRGLNAAQQQQYVQVSNVELQNRHANLPGHPLYQLVPGANGMPPQLVLVKDLTGTLQPTAPINTAAAKPKTTPKPVARQTKSTAKIPTGSTASAEPPAEDKKVTKPKVEPRQAKAPAKEPRVIPRDRVASAETKGTGSTGTDAMIKPPDTEDPPLAPPAAPPSPPPASGSELADKVLADLEGRRKAGEAQKAQLEAEKKKIAASAPPNPYAYKGTGEGKETPDYKAEVPLNYGRLDFFKRWAPNNERHVFISKGKFSRDLEYDATDLIDGYEFKHSRTKAEEIGVTIIPGKDDYSRNNYYANMEFNKPGVYCITLGHLPGIRDIVVDVPDFTAVLNDAKTNTKGKWGAITAKQEATVTYYDRGVAVKVEPLNPNPKLAGVADYYYHTESNTVYARRGANYTRFDVESNTWMDLQGTLPDFLLWDKDINTMDLEEQSLTDLKTVLVHPRLGNQRKSEMVKFLAQKWFEKTDSVSAFGLKVLEEFLTFNAIPADARTFALQTAGRNWFKSANQDTMMDFAKINTVQMTTMKTLAKEAFVALKGGKADGDTVQMFIAGFNFRSDTSAEIAKELADAFNSAAPAGYEQAKVEDKRCIIARK